MVSLTQKEKEALLILFKDFTAFYNANSISKILSISHVGAQKIFKRLLNENLLIYKKIGKSIIYKLNLVDDYARKLMAFLLADEANKFKRWKEEFKQLFKKDINEVNNIIKEKEEILPKKLHVIKLTANDLLKNIKEKKEAVLDIVKNAVILYGQDKYVRVIKNVTSI